MMNVEFNLDPAAPPQEPLVFGRAIPERKDDFAWENKVVAYRIYGPALEATGEISSGIDVWSKRIPNFVVDSFYKQDHERCGHTQFRIVLPQRQWNRTRLL